MKYTNALLMAVALLATPATGCLQMVEPGYVALEVAKCGSHAGDYSVATTGYNWVHPTCTDLYEFPVHVQNITWTANPTEGSRKDESIRFTTVDDQAIGVNLAIDYQYDAERISTMFDTFRVDDQQFVNTHLRNRIRDAFNACVVKPGNDLPPLEVQDLSPNRTALFDCVENTVNVYFEQYGVKIGQIGQIDEFIWPDSVRQAIESSVKATTDAQRVENELQQTAAEAQKVREAARGAADAKVTEAEGTARAILVEAKAQAEANTLLAKSLTPTLVQYRKIEKWDGQQPQTVLGGNANAFISVGNDTER